ncbi:hypothetical protein [Streptomyces europaeiscabiei]|uniref:hypothetical protein n=1 Tax=Streptomyces europaeiscabiei TaxID=146819 RepID=UPI0029A724D1|nr:hypothetical protein [Streptomyces europaeiscabiei]MDX3613306.1 hypothetical protein [Streptomyces europaeiscabiei]
MAGFFASFGARRRAAAAAQWETFQSEAAQRAHLGVQVAQLKSIYQRARNGHKAWIVWHETGARQDTWFHGGAPCREGMFVLLHGSVGYGPHNNNPRVLYVRPSDVIGVATAQSLRAWRKQQGRS